MIFLLLAINFFKESFSDMRVIAEPSIMQSWLSEILLNVTSRTSLALLSVPNPGPTTTASAVEIAVVRDTLSKK